PDASVADRLIDRAQREDHPAHRRMALRSLIRIAPLPDERTNEARLELLKKAMQMCEQDADRLAALERAKAVRIVETLRYLLPYLQQPKFAEQASLTIVELAHHSGLREAHRSEFHEALDQVIETSGDPVVIDRANHYKKGQTWVRPKSPR
ncbi:MAG: hypothetical protein AAF961_02505, partial [Planctomycetota bacterium]